MKTAKEIYNETVRYDHIYYRGTNEHAQSLEAMREYAFLAVKEYQRWVSNQVLRGRTSEKLLADFNKEHKIF